MMSPGISSHATGKAGASISLRSSEFRKGREQTWRELDDLITRIEKSGIGTVSASQLQKMPSLYRATLSSLAVARSIALDRNLLQYLEALSLRAYMIIYGPRGGLLRGFARFFGHDFPALIRSTGSYILISFLCLSIGIVAGFVLVNSDSEWFHVFVPQSFAGGRGPESSPVSLRDSIFAPWSGYIDTFVVFSNYLFRHNSMVAILCFGLGFIAGIPTAFLMMYQGVMIGAFLAVHYQKGLLIDFVGWLSIHGVTELGAFVICGAAGFLIAGKILFPDRYSRYESLSIYGRQAAMMVAGGVAMLFVAGILEGGFRQLINVTEARYAFAASTALFWFCYFMSGRQKDRLQ